MSPLLPHSSAARVWARLEAVGLVPDFGEEASRLLVALYRRLAGTGRPVTPTEVTALALTAGMDPAGATTFLEPLSEIAEDGALLGVAGLSLADHPHRFRTHGHDLATWCALDPLLIAPVMTEPVTIVSHDPRSGAPIEVHVGPDGVHAVHPPSAIVSVVVPAAPTADGVEAIWAMFCHHVHFFTDTASGTAFFVTDEQEVHLLPVAAAFDLGRIVYRTIHTEA